MAAQLLHFWQQHFDLTPGCLETLAINYWRQINFAVSKPLIQEFSNLVSGRFLRLPRSPSP